MFAFMDLEKAYDRITREGMWKMLSNYGIGGKLLEGVKSFYLMVIPSLAGLAVSSSCQVVLSMQDWHTEA